MPTKREREYYRMGYEDGRRSSDLGFGDLQPRVDKLISRNPPKRPKRKLSAWNKYVKANSNKPRFRYRNGKLNLKKMGVAFRKTPAGRKKK